MVTQKRILHVLICLFFIAVMIGAAYRPNSSALAAGDTPPGQGPGSSTPPAAAPASVAPDGAPVGQLSEQNDAATASGSDLPASPQGGGGSSSPGAHFLHLSVSGNISLHVTYLDYPLLNQEPHALFIATHHLQPDGYANNYNDDALGVYWGGSGRWAVFNEKTNMLAGRAFNIYAPPSDRIFTTTTTLGNISQGLTFIDNPLLNGHPEAKAFAMHNYNLSAGGSGAYHTHNLGVYYTASVGKWGIYNQDQVAMPTGVVFNYTVAGPYDVSFTHTASVGNITANYTILDNPALNGNPNALLTVTPVYITSRFDRAFGVWYNTFLKKWTIFAEDTEPMSPGAAFNVLATPIRSGAFVHVVSAANIHPTSTNMSALNHPYLNGNPDALVFITHDLNPPENYATRIYEPHPLSLFYLADTVHPDGRWYIYTLDKTPISAGLAFNVYYSSPQTNAYSMETTASSATSAPLNSALLNGVPGAAAQVMQNFNPNNHPSQKTAYPYPVGLQYSSGLWRISRPSGPNLLIDMAFNVFVPQVDFFIHTASSGNIQSLASTLSSSLTNNNPWALVFVTPNGTPNGVNQFVNEAPIGVYYNGSRWAVYNDNLVSMTAGTAYNVFVVDRYPLFLPAILKK